MGLIWSPVTPELITQENRKYVRSALFPHWGGDPDVPQFICFSISMFSGPLFPIIYVAQSLCSLLLYAPQSQCLWMVESSLVSPVGYTMCIPMVYYVPVAYKFRATRTLSTGGSDFEQCVTHLNESSTLSSPWMLLTMVSGKKRYLSNIWSALGTL